MDRENIFDNYLESCRSREEFCGQGNPNSDILIIGKEPYCRTECNEDENRKKRKDNYDLCKDLNLRDAPREGKQSPTWLNYQYLIDLIYKRKTHENKVDFERFAFTTELNKLARPKARLDKETKDNIYERLLFFKESNFIQSFPVVILACGPFIKNTGEGVDRQIDNTFNACYNKEIKTTNGYKFYTHYNKEDTQLIKAGEKLIIHTRQLSNFRRGDGKRLIEAMSETIHNHLHRLGLI